MTHEDATVCIFRTQQTGRVIAAFRYRSVRRRGS